MQEILQQITDALVPILCLLIVYGGRYLVALLKAKTAQIEQDKDNAVAAKYTAIAVDAVETAVASISQTYVDVLKADDAFTKGAQTVAFEQAREMALNIMGETAVSVLTELYGDLDEWLGAQIEQTVKLSK